MLVGTPTSLSVVASGTSTVAPTLQLSLMELCGTNSRVDIQAFHLSWVNQQELGYWPYGKDMFNLTATAQMAKLTVTLRHLRAGVTGMCHYTWLHNVF